MLVGTRYQAALVEKRACDYFQRSKAGIKAVFNVTAMERSILAELFERGGRQGMTQEYSTCLEKSNGITIEMINCILAETRRQDARLNENYKRLISKLATERKKRIG